METIDKKIYTDALAAQDACNFTAVTGLLRETAKTVMHSKGMDAIATDPAIILIMDKLNDLIHRPDDAAFGKAYDFCRLA